MNHTKSVVFTKIMVDVLFYLGIIVCVTLPVSLRYFSSWFQIYAELYWQMLIIFEIAGILGLVILRHLARVMNTIFQKQCFVMENVRNLKVMGVCGYLIAADMLSRLFFVVTPSIFILVLAFFTAGLFCFILAQVFEEAICYKEENELTI